MPPLFSLIVPTRKRPRQLRTFLESVALTAANPSAIEIVLVIDEDDPESTEVTCDGVQLTHVILPAGLTMGALNSAGYAHSTGRYLMLLNDDVVCRSPGWDQSIHACFQVCPHALLLVHVNDTLMRTELCTFPIVSRQFCQIAGGICPVDYRRYRIDDHIEDVFNLLGVLGEQRSLYLPTVVFEHQNFEERVTGLRQYFSDEKILAEDAPTFERLLPERKETALQLMACLYPMADSSTRAAWRAKLETITDSFALRTLDRLREVRDFSAQNLDELRERIQNRMAGPAVRQPGRTWKEKLGGLWSRARARIRESGYGGLVTAVCRKTWRGISSLIAPRSRASEEINSESAG